MRLREGIYGTKIPVLREESTIEELIDKWKRIDRESGFILPIADIQRNLKCCRLEPIKIVYNYIGVEEDGQLEMIFTQYDYERRK